MVNLLVEGVISMEILLVVLVVSLVIFLATRKRDSIFHVGRIIGRELTWQDKVIIAAQVKRAKRNARRVRENNPLLFVPGVRNSITRVK